MSSSKYKQKYAFFVHKEVSFLVIITVIQWALLRMIPFKMVAPVRSSNHWVPKVLLKNNFSNYKFKMFSA
jgi:hypothetical protein